MSLESCSVGQVGDREWWCATHRRNAEECHAPAGFCLHNCGGAACRSHPCVCPDWCADHGIGCSPQDCPCGHSIGCTCWSDKDG